MAETDPVEPSFTTSDGLRRLIHRLNTEGAGPRPKLGRTMAAEARQATLAELAARSELDREAAALFAYIIRRYAQLCRKWDREPLDAAVAAFEAMQGDYILGADDPWAIITIAVRASVISEAQSEKLLISPDRARQGDTIDWDSPVRAGEHEEFLFGLAPDRDAAEPESPTWAHMHRVITGLFGEFRWDRGVIDLAVTYVLNRLLAAGEPGRAHEHLRRAPSMPAQLDMSTARWRAFLRILFDGRASENAPVRRGLLHRVALLDPKGHLDELIEELADDSDLIEAMKTARGL